MTHVREGTDRWHQTDELEAEGHVHDMWGQRLLRLLHEMAERPMQRHFA